MDEREVKELCEAAMLEFDGPAFESLVLMSQRMEAVVNSPLCVKGKRDEMRGEAVLRADEVRCEYSREEMLKGAGCRKGNFAVVPQLIK